MKLFVRSFPYPRPTGKNSDLISTIMIMRHFKLEVNNHGSPLKCHLSTSCSVFVLIIVALMDALIYKVGTNVTSSFVYLVGRGRRVGHTTTNFLFSLN